MKSERDSKIVFYFLRWVQSVVDLITALVKVATLGFFYPNWDFDFLSWRAKRDLRIKQNKTKE